MKRRNLTLFIVLAAWAMLVLAASIDARPADDGRVSKHDAPADMDGDGRTDFVIARVSGVDSPVRWYCAMADGSIDSSFVWGHVGPPPTGDRDRPVIGDFDGDHKDDIAVWRPGKQGRFYVINSATMTITVEDLGTKGDDPMVVGDYDGDRRDDFAVYRPGFWFYKTSADSDFVTIPFGKVGDRPAPGDYDGDRRDDIVVVRFPDSDTAVFYKLLSNGTYTVEELDLRSSVPNQETIAVPGDFDGDFKTDLAVVNILDDYERSYLWRYRSSLTGETTEVIWGKVDNGMDLVVPGDYDGDGRYDFAVWRGTGFESPAKFYILTSGSGEIIVKEWGMSGYFRDYPVANMFKGPVVVFWGWM